MTTNFRSIEDIPPPYRCIFQQYPCFNAVQTQVFDDALNTDKSLVVAAPTGSGKTVIFELAIVRLLMLNSTENIKAIYICPIKALCQEKLNDWHKKFSEFDIRCMSLTSDTDEFDPRCVLNYQIILATPEKWDVITRRWRDHLNFVRAINLFMIDEVHLLNADNRGSTLEVIVSRMKTIDTFVLNQGNAKIRFVAVSATIPNVEDIGEWIGPSGSAIHYKFSEDVRPVKLNKIVYGFTFHPKDQSVFKFDWSLNYKLQNLISKYSEGQPTLIFCSTRKSVEMTAKHLVDNLQIRLKQEQKAMLNEISSRLTDVKLQQYVMNGIAFHHAGLVRENRYSIEEAFRQGHIPILVTTSTLAMGVNLPAHLVIIKSTKCYDYSGGYKDYDEVSIFQMIGRAGRSQFDTCATALILTTAQDKAKYENMVACTQPIESNLHKHLTEHLNAEIVLKTITDLEVAMRWLSSTFLYVRAKKCPEKYKLPVGLTQEKIDKKLLEICQIDLNKLVGAGMVNINQCIEISPTVIGEIMAKYYVAFDTMKLFTKITGTEIMIQLLGIFSKCSEFSDIRLRANDKKCLNLLNKHSTKETIRFPLSGKVKSSDMKVNCIIQAMLGNLEIHDQSILNDSSRIMRSCERLSKCLIEYLETRPNSYSALLNAIILAKCFKAKLWENSVYVCKQLTGVGQVFSQTMAKAGLTSFKKIIDTNPRVIEMHIGRKPPFGNNIVEQAKGLPQYEMKVEKRENTVLVEINLVNLQEIQAKCTVDLYSTMTLLVGDSDNNLIIYEKYSHSYMLDSPTITKIVKIENQDLESVTASFISDDWVGFDCNQTLRIIEKAPIVKPSPNKSKQTVLDMYMKQVKKRPKTTKKTVKANRTNSKIDIQQNKRNSAENIENNCAKKSEIENKILEVSQNKDNKQNKENKEDKIVCDEVVMSDINIQSKVDKLVEEMNDDKNYMNDFNIDSLENALQELKENHFFEADSNTNKNESNLQREDSPKKINIKKKRKILIGSKLSTYNKENNQNSKKILSKKSKLSELNKKIELNKSIQNQNSETVTSTNCENLEAKNPDNDRPYVIKEVIEPKNNNNTNNSKDEANLLQNSFLEFYNDLFGPELMNLLEKHKKLSNNNKNENRTTEDCGEKISENTMAKPDSTADRGKFHFTSLLSPDTSNSRTRTNCFENSQQKTIKWRSPLIHSPQNKFSPCLNRSVRSDLQTSREDKDNSKDSIDVHVGLNECSFNSSLLTNLSQNEKKTVSSKKSARFPIRDQDYEEKNKNIFEKSENENSIFDLEYYGLSNTKRSNADKDKPAISQASARDYYFNELRTTSKTPPIKANKSYSNDIEEGNILASEDLLNSSTLSGFNKRYSLERPTHRSNCEEEAHNDSRLLYSNPSAVHLSHEYYPEGLIQSNSRNVCCTPIRSAESTIVREQEVLLSQHDSLYQQAMEPRRILHPQYRFNPYYNEERSAYFSPAATPRGVMMGHGFEQPIIYSENYLPGYSQPVPRLLSQDCYLNNGTGPTLHHRLDRDDAIYPPYHNQIEQPPVRCLPSLNNQKRMLKEEMYSQELYRNSALLNQSFRDEDKLRSVQMATNTNMSTNNTNSRRIMNSKADQFKNNTFQTVSPEKERLPTKSQLKEAYGCTPKKKLIHDSPNTLYKFKPDFSVSSNLMNLARTFSDEALNQASQTKTQPYLFDLPNPVSHQPSHLTQMPNRFNNGQQVKPQKYLFQSSSSSLKSKPVLQQSSHSMELPNNFNQDVLSQISQARPQNYLYNSQSPSYNGFVISKPVLQQSSRPVRVSNGFNEEALSQLSHERSQTYLQGTQSQLTNSLVRQPYVFNTINDQNYWVHNSMNKNT